MRYACTHLLAFCLLPSSQTEHCDGHFSMDVTCSCHKPLSHTAATLRLIGSYQGCCIGPIVTQSRGYFRGLPMHSVTATNPNPNPNPYPNLNQIIPLHACCAVHNGPAEDFPDPLETTLCFCRATNHPLCAEHTYPNPNPNPNHKTLRV